MLKIKRSQKTNPLTQNPKLAMASQDWILKRKIIESHKWANAEAKKKKKVKSKLLISDIF
jgi:hypothetical protein